jgi:hypothetical protein
MFLEFSVSNFRSIKDKAVLSMVAGPERDLEGTNTLPTDLSSLPRALRVSALYGGNAAGKSNLIKALDFMRSFVLNSATATQEGQAIEVDAYAFDAKARQEPTSLEVQFVESGIRYEYGFKLDRERVLEEWLSSSPKGRIAKWFSRIYRPEMKTYEYEFGSYFQGQKQVWEKSTRSNALFLSTAVQLNSDQLKPVFNWFMVRLRIVPDTRSLPRDAGVKLLEKIPLKKQILEFMRNADPTIKDLIVTETKNDIPALYRAALLNEEIYKDVQVLHKNAEDTGAQFTLNDESRGTQQLFAMVFPWIASRGLGQTLFVDELDSSLHPLMTRALVDFFQKDAPADTKAQLFFTTHDTSLLSGDLLRRDQIWFIERDNEGSSRLYPLTEFSPRKNEALENGYLRGRYGALPKIEELAL